MPPVRRISVRKKRSSRPGRHVILCRVGPKKTPCRVHADLLCRSSAFFRQALQPNRRKVEGECSICQEVLRPGDEELTHCIAHCGANFHFSCIEGWKQRGPSTARCPLCRREWEEISANRQTFPDIREQSFEVYTEWLYRKRVLVDYDDYDQYYEDLVGAYCVGIHFQDDSFCNAILHAMVEWFSDTDEYPGGEFVTKVYEMTPGPCSLRKLMVDIYLNTRADQAELEDGWGDLPEQFVRELALAFMKRSSSDEKDWTLATLKEVTKLQGMDDTEDEVSESESDESDEG